MKAAIVLAMATLFLALVLASVISSGLGTLTSAVKAEAIGTYLHWLRRLRRRHLRGHT